MLDKQSLRKLAIVHALDAIYGGAETCDKIIVDNHGVIGGAEEAENSVTANVASTATHENVLVNDGRRCHDDDFVGLFVVLFVVCDYRNFAFSSNPDSVRCYVVLLHIPFVFLGPPTLPIRINSPCNGSWRSFFVIYIFPACSLMTGG